MKMLSTILFLCSCLVTTSVFAQSVDEEQLSRELINAKKKRIVSQNMKLTDQEKKLFWPLYEKYQEVLNRNNARSVILIEQYVKANSDLTDEQATQIIKEYFDIEEERLKLQKYYAVRFGKILPAKKLVRYYQIENKLDAVIENELVNLIPLAR